MEQIIVSIVEAVNDTLSLNSVVSPLQTGLAVKETFGGG